MANMAHHRVQQSQQQTNTFSVGLSAEVNHDGEPLEAAAAFSPHGHHHGLHSLYSSGFLRKPRKNWTKSECPIFGKWSLVALIFIQATQTVPFMKDDIFK